MDKIIERVSADVCTELQKTMTKWPLFNSRHEGYGVILEELDELWDEVKKRKPDIKNMRAEAVQVAAMAMKFIMSMENEWKPNLEIKKSENPYKGNEEELRMIEQKCHECLYDVMTNEELEKLGVDPCDTCTNFSNWKPKEAKADDRQ